MNRVTSLRILQFNVCHSFLTHTEILIEAVGRWDLIAIQEPGIQDRGWGPFTATNPAFHTVFHANLTARTCFHVLKAVDIGKWEFGRVDPLIQTLHLRTNFTTLNIHNIYNQDRTLPFSAFTDLLSLPGEHVLVGDFNLHHSKWGGERVRNAEATAESLAATIPSTLTLATPRGLRTWERTGQENASWATIDLAFLTTGISYRLEFCGEVRDLPLPSDYIPIQLILNTSITPSKTTQRR